MSLWLHWWNAIWRLRPAFSRLQTFLWFATAVAGFTVRTDMLGVTSIVRALNLNARYYNANTGTFLVQDPKGFAAGQTNRIKRILLLYSANDFRHANIESG